MLLRVLDMKRINQSCFPSLSKERRELHPRATLSKKLSSYSRSPFLIMCCVRCYTAQILVKK